MPKKKKDNKKDTPVVNTVIEDGEPKPEDITVAPPIKKNAPVKEKVRPGLLKVTSKQYTQAKGIRWERAAGFLHWVASKYGAGYRLTVPEWIEMHAQYNATPVGGLGTP